MIKNGPTPSSDTAVEVDSWFQRNYTDYPDGINEYHTNANGFEIELDHSINTELFIEAVGSVKELSGTRLNDGSVSVQKVEEIGDGLLHRHSIGVTFGPDDTVSLGGYDEPIDPSGEPVDTVVEHTLTILNIYLSKQKKWVE